MKRKSSWRKEYLEILNNGPEGRNQNLARELIDEKYADGIYSLDSDMKAEIVLWRYITTKGRLFAEQLENELHKETIEYRVKIGFLALMSWGVGIFTAYITAYFSAK